MKDKNCWGCGEKKHSYSIGGENNTLMLEDTIEVFEKLNNQIAT